MRHFLALLALVVITLRGEGAETLKPELVVQNSSSPLITFRFLFQTGAAYDPPGKEGVAALTASVVAQGGTRALAYEEILKRMYPMAASFDAQVDKEMTVFMGTTHLDNLTKYYALIKEMLLTPGFREEDFSRVKSDAINFLKVSLREGNDEELGKERLYNIIYEGHPYEHHTAGSISALEKMTLTDVKSFYATHYTQARLTIGLAGKVPDEFAKQVQADFAALPAGTANKLELETPELRTGMRVDIVQRETRSTAISLGFPISVRRGDKDYAALYLVASWFGQHRSSNSHLYQRLREARGLNYGDYAYVEYFPKGMYQFQPDPNLGRQEQIFQIWIRPVPPDQAIFALRATLYEFDKLITNGLSKEAFETTREFLTKYVNVLTQTQDGMLGYELDSRYYGIPTFNEYLKEELAKLTLEQVNSAIKTHLKPELLRVVLVTKDAAATSAGLTNGKPSPITYNSPKPDDILAEDKIIERYPIPTRPEWITITPVEKVFQ